MGEGKVDTLHVIDEYGKAEMTIYSFLTSALDRANGKLHAPASVCIGKGRLVPTEQDMASPPEPF